MSQVQAVRGTALPRDASPTWIGYAPRGRKAPALAVSALHSLDNGAGSEFLRASASCRQQEERRQSDALRSSKGKFHGKDTKPTNRQACPLNSAKELGEEEFHREIGGVVGEDTPEICVARFLEFR